MQTFRRSAPGRLAILISVSVFTLAGSAAAGTPLASSLVAEGLGLPVFVTHAPNDFGRIFVVGRAGVIRIIRLDGTGVVQTPFLTVPGVNTVEEHGLVGMAFDPDYSSNGYFYVKYNNTAGDAVVARYSRSAANPDLADPASALTLMQIDREGTVHTAGWIAFGPDGMLYITEGDGAGEPQLMDNLGGKILRIDVDGDDFPADPLRNYRIPSDNPLVGVAGARPEIWLAGLRNPWRCSFDSATGDLYIADVGAANWEEVNFVPAGSGFANYGWPCFEGNGPFTEPGVVCPPVPRPPLVGPILTYNHVQDLPPLNYHGCAIMGGEVYRGCAIPDLSGEYFFADFCTNRVYSMRYDGASITAITDRSAQLDPPGSAEIFAVVSFGRDAFGELYMCQVNGRVYKIVPAGGAAPDCNGNARADGCDIRAGSSLDSNGNGIPDECEAQPGDVDGDGDVDLSDLTAILASFGLCAGHPAFNADADFNADGCISINDLTVLLANFGN